MVTHLDAHPLFRRLSKEETDVDPCVPSVMNDTEEGIKVARNNGDKFLAVYERLERPWVEGSQWDGFDPMLSLVPPANKAPANKAPAKGPSKATAKTEIVIADR